MEILPRQRTFGEDLMPALGSILQSFGPEGAFAKQRAVAQDNEIINSFNPDDPPLVQMQKFAKLSAGRQAALSPLMTQIVKSQQKQAEGTAKTAAKQQEEAQETAGLENSLDFLDANKQYAGMSHVPGLKSFTMGGLNRETVEKREEMDRSGFLAADAIFTKYNKGTISKDKLKLVQDMAPKSTDSERVYQAKINALRRMAKLSPGTSKDDFNKQFTREVKAVGKAQPVRSQGTTKRVLAPNGKEYDIPEEEVANAVANGGKLI